MVDIWEFLLQTLTASGVALLLLAVKALFKDKLPPKWHFLVWGVLGLLMLIPAGWNGRYTVIHWQYVVELIKTVASDFRFTRVLFPVPMVVSVPRNLWDWLFIVYFAGVIVQLANYLYAYIRLRLVLRQGIPATGTVTDKVTELSAQIQVRPCRVIEVHGLPSAFVCGIFRPVLAIPAGKPIDDKILLHELMHLKSKDTLWSVVICVLRSIHWCNPLITCCANEAINDMEYRCDQFVLEQLEGEQRREYGHILLSMVNERFAKTPGTTCVNNGGRHIRKRIETIARFKKYPVGMQLVSVCILVVLTISLAIGVRATVLHGNHSFSPAEKFASARSIPCTTYAGAFDTYGKAVLDWNGYFRAMCAPSSMQEEIYNELVEKKNIEPHWDSGLLPCWPNSQAGYYVYNLTQPEPNVYEGLLVIKLNYPPDGLPGEYGMMYLAVQTVRVENENGRWVAIPTEDFRCVEASDQDLAWGCSALPGTVYAGTAMNMKIEVNMQTVYTVENEQPAETTQWLFGSLTLYNIIPQPNGSFTRAVITHSDRVTHLGTQEERNAIAGIGISVAPVYPRQQRPENLRPAIGYDSGGGSNTGESWASQKTEPGWGPSLELGGGGGGSFDPTQNVLLPEYYAADLYLNDSIAAQLELFPQKEVVK